MIAAKFAAVVLVGYFLGAIPFGVMIARRSAKVDVTSYGSGKTGATNVLRVAGKKAAAAVVVFDVLKGFLPVMNVPSHAIRVDIFASMGLKKRFEGVRDSM